MGEGRKVILIIALVVIIPVFLIVAAIVAGAIFATVQDTSTGCEGEIPPALEAAQNEGFGVTNFGISEERKSQIELSNLGQERVTVMEFQMGAQQRPSNISLPENISVGDEEVFQFNQFSPADNCHEAIIDITYKTDGINNQMQGTIEAKMEPTAG